MILSKTKNPKGWNVESGVNARLVACTKCGTVMRMGDAWVDKTILCERCANTVLKNRQAVYANDLIRLMIGWSK